MGCQKEDYVCYVQGHRLLQLIIIPMKNEY